LRWPWPVAPVADALEAIGIINQPLASIARREEIIYVPGQEGVPIIPDRFSPILHLVLQQLDVSGDMHRLQHAPERINPLPVAPVQKGGSGPRISGPRVPVADVDGEVFEEAQRGPIPGTGDERGKHRP